MVLRGGELDGVPVLNEHTVSEAVRPSTNGEIDAFIKRPVGWAQGFQIGGPGIRETCVGSSVSAAVRARRSATPAMPPARRGPIRPWIWSSSICPASSRPSTTAFVTSARSVTRCERSSPDGRAAHRLHRTRRSRDRLDSYTTRQDAARRANPPTYALCVVDRLRNMLEH
jgi:hypothetical protein